MLTPYDWQEGIGHRAQYVENRLRSGVPVVGISTNAGVIIATFRHHSRKVFEIYDRIAFSALGVAGDVEALRTTAIDFCHQEGFRRSEEDVTVRRVVAAISEPIKEAFGNFRVAPMTVRGLFAELGTTPEEDLFYVLDYDGDFALRRGSAHLAGSTAAWDVLKEKLATTDFAAMSVDVAAESLKGLIQRVVEEGEDHRDLTLVFEAGLIDRSIKGDRKFKLIASDTDA